MEGNVCRSKDCAGCPPIRLSGFGISCSNFLVKIAFEGQNPAQVLVVRYQWQRQALFIGEYRQLGLGGLQKIAWIDHLIDNPISFIHNPRVQ